jgi:hypothetical protein
MSRVRRARPECDLGHTSLQIKTGEGLARSSDAGLACHGKEAP